MVKIKRIALGVNAVMPHPLNFQLLLIIGVGKALVVKMDKVIDKLAWITICDGKFLVVRSKGKELFYLPGGKREAGESDEQALVREIKEELSVDLKPETIKYADTFVAQADGKASGVSVKLTCYFADYRGELEADAEIEELRFIDSNDQSICSLAALVVLQSLAENALIK